jgi:hypothetical protein
MTTSINELREHLMGTLASLRDRENPMEPDRARAVASVASVLVDTARVEVDYIKATGQEESSFLGSDKQDQPRLEQDGPTAHNPFPRVVRHQLAG